VAVLVELQLRQPLERADVVALLTGVPRRQPVRVIHTQVSWGADHHCPYPEADALTWVKRNEDKSHRCPCCHAVSTYGKGRKTGPRTRVVCARGCGVQWRLGGRDDGTSTLHRKRLESGGILPHRYPRFVEHSSTGRRRRGWP